MKVHRSALKHGVLSEDVIQAADLSLWIEPLELWLSGPGRVKFEFKGNTDVAYLKKLIAHHVL